MNFVFNMVFLVLFFSICHATPLKKDMSEPNHKTLLNHVEAEVLIDPGVLINEDNIRRKKSAVEDPTENRNELTDVAAPQHDSTGRHSRQVSGHAENTMDSQQPVGDRTMGDIPKSMDNEAMLGQSPKTYGQGGYYASSFHMPAQPVTYSTSYQMPVHEAHPVTYTTSYQMPVHEAHPVTYTTSYQLPVHEAYQVAYSVPQTMQQIIMLQPPKPHRPINKPIIRPRPTIYHSHQYIKQYDIPSANPHPVYPNVSPMFATSVPHKEVIPSYIQQYSGQSYANRPTYSPSPIYRESDEPQLSSPYIIQAPEMQQPFMEGRMMEDSAQVPTDYSLEMLQVAIDQEQERIDLLKSQLQYDMMVTNGRKNKRESDSAVPFLQLEGETSIEQENAI